MEHMWMTYFAAENLGLKKYPRRLTKKFKTNLTKWLLFTFAGINIRKQPDDAFVIGQLFYHKMLETLDGMVTWSESRSMRMKLAWMTNTLPSLAVDISQLAQMRTLELRPARGDKDRGLFGSECESVQDSDNESEDGNIRPSHIHCATRRREKRGFASGWRCLRLAAVLPVEQSSECWHVRNGCTENKWHNWRQVRSLTVMYAHNHQQTFPNAGYTNIKYQPSLISEQYVRIPQQ